MDGKAPARRTRVLAIWLLAALGCSAGLAIGMAGGEPVAAVPDERKPPIPSGPVAAAAYRVFDVRCAGCHQSGALTAPAPSGGFHHVLEMDVLARDRAKVEPANPLASPVFAALTSPSHPGGGEPAAADVLAVHDWISALPRVSERQGEAAPADPVAGAVSLSADRHSYTAGDAVRFALRSTAPCHWTVINIRDGLATVLLPNSFERETFAQAGEIRWLPRETAPYTLRFTEAGHETFVAFCGPKSHSTIGIEHRYGRQKFTYLGGWRDFVAARFGARPENAKGRENARGTSLALVPRASIVVDVGH